MDKLLVEIKISDYWNLQFMRIIDFFNYISPILLFTI